ncbi:hypothetical protein [Ferrimonas balearica]|uniref:hypothetical protein n=1 Tax=Ferrimonas balearica TaxID=44012 RepID=UPI001C994D6B|nr:hypothetical protein [Ferrimonas balearica]MBY5993815.1 hypothetical protein [Ferrimonas balearica]
MNTLVEYEAARLEQLLESDPLAARMFMETMHMPLDVQDSILSEVSKLRRRDRNALAQVIEQHGISVLPDQISR